MHCMPTLSASASPLQVIFLLLFQNIPLHFAFITAICPSEFSSDTYTPGSFPASYPQCRIGASQSVPVSLLLAISYILAGDQRREQSESVFQLGSLQVDHVVHPQLVRQCFAYSP